MSYRVTGEDERFDTLPLAEAAALRRWQRQGCSPSVLDEERNLVASEVRCGEIRRRVPLEEPLPSLAPALCSHCQTGWYATHAGAGYAYIACQCDYAGSTVPASYPAPAGMEITASICGVYPHGLTTA